MELKFNTLRAPNGETARSRFLLTQGTEGNDMVQALWKSQVHVEKPSIDFAMPEKEVIWEKIIIILIIINHYYRRR